MAEQHYYTRERRGLFRSAEGYDSIAKSSGVSDVFIKKNLHPFCFYDPPRKLDETREKDTSKYPESFMAFNAESGEMVIGRSIYKSADFTGLRSTFFTHQYILGRTEKENYIRDMDRVVAAGGFVGGYDIEKGKALNDVDEIIIDASVNRSENAHALLSSLGMEENTYLKLLYASIISAGGKKKIYVALNTDVSSISRNAKSIIGMILKGLPLEIRRNFGFITYSREPESRKYINITFVEPEALKGRDPRADKDYIFDFVNNKFPDLDAEANSHPYISYVRSQMGNLRVLDRLFQFSEESLYGMRQEDKLSIVSYDELSVLYQIYEGNMNLYESSRHAVINNIMRYADAAASIESKVKLSRLLHTLIEKERDDTTLKNYIPSNSMIETFIKLYQYKIQDINANIHHTIYLTISKYNKDNQYDDICNILSSIAVNKDMLAPIIEAIIQSIQMSEIFRYYLDKRFLKLHEFRELTNEAAYWDDTMKLVLFSRQFIYLFKDRVMTILKKSEDSIETANMMYDSIVTFIKKHNLEHGKYKEAFSAILAEIDDYIFNSIDLESISKRDLLRIRVRNRRSSTKYEIIEYMQSFLSEDNGIVVRDDSILKEGSGEQVRRLIRRLYKDSIHEGNYNKIIEGFKNPFGTVEYDYDSLLEYIRSNKNDKEACNFIKWSFENMISSYSESIDEYKDSVEDYFYNSYPEAFKNREIRKLIYNTRDKGLKNLLKDIEFELSSPIMKLLISNKKSIALGTAALILLSAVIFVSVSIISDIREKEITNATAEFISTTAVGIKDNSGDLLKNYDFVVDGSITFKDSERKAVNFKIMSSQIENEKLQDDDNIIDTDKTITKGYRECSTAYNVKLVKKSDKQQDDSINEINLLDAIENDVNEKLDNFVKEYFSKYY